MQTIYLDISNKGVLPTIYAKQGDVGRKFLAVITDNGTVISGLQSPVFSVWYEGASGSGNYSVIDDRPAAVFDGKKAEVEMIAQMLVNAGKGQMTIVLNDALGKQIGLWNIEYCVEPVAGQGSEEAKGYFTALSETAARAIAAAERAENAAAGFYVDNTLTQEGASADAKATGEKIKLLQDSLGSKVSTETTLVNSVDEITKSGYYELDVSVNGAMGRFACSAVVGGGEVRLIGSLDGGTLQHTKAGGWEWVAPPMQPDMEYRTTERFEGKPVYTKFVSLGSLPDTSSKTIPHNITNLSAMVSSFVAFGENNRFPYVVPYYDTSNNAFTIVAQIGAAITIKTTVNVSRYSGIAVLKYTKA